MNDLEEKFKRLKENFKYISGEVEEHAFNLMKKKIGNKNVTLNEIEEGEQLKDIQVVVLEKISERMRPRCSVCYHFYSDKKAGDIVSCTSYKCKGQQREIKDVIEQVYFTGNDTGAFLLNILPEELGLNTTDLEGYYVSLSGKVGKKGIYKAYPNKHIVYTTKIKLLYNIFDEKTILQYPKKEEHVAEEKVEEKKEEEPEWVKKLEATILMADGSLTDNMLSTFMKKWCLKQEDVLKYLMKTGDGKWVLKRTLEQ